MPSKMRTAILSISSSPAWGHGWCRAGVTQYKATALKFMAYPHGDSRPRQPLTRPPPRTRAGSTPRPSTSVARAPFVSRGLLLQPPGERDTPHWPGCHRRAQPRCFRQPHAHPTALLFHAQRVLHTVQASPHFQAQLFKRSGVFGMYSGLCLFRLSGRCGVWVSRCGHKF